MKIKSIHVELVRATGAGGEPAPVIIQVRETRVPLEELSFDWRKSIGKGPFDIDSFIEQMVRSVMVTAGKGECENKSGRAYRLGKFLRLWKQLIHRQYQNERFLERRHATIVTGCVFAVYVETDTDKYTFTGCMNEFFPEDPEELLTHIGTYIPLLMKIGTPRKGSEDLVRTRRSVGDGEHCIDFSLTDSYEVVRNFTKERFSEPWQGTELTDSWWNLISAWNEQRGEYPLTVGGKLKYHQTIVNDVRRAIDAKEYRADAPIGYLWRKLLPEFDWEDFFYFYNDDIHYLEQD